MTSMLLTALRHDGHLSLWPAEVVHGGRAGRPRDDGHLDPAGGVPPHQRGGQRSGGQTEPGEVPQKRGSHTDLRVGGFGLVFA